MIIKEAAVLVYENNVWMIDKLYSFYHLGQAPHGDASESIFHQDSTCR
jgi:hypothetical protein